MGFFSKKGIKPDRSKLEEAEKWHTSKIAIIEKIFWYFRTLLNYLYQIIVHLNTLTHTLREFLHKDINFQSTGTCNEAFGKLKLCMSSDTYLSYFDKPI